MPLNKDSTMGTFAVAALLCIVCSFVVSAAAVSLKDKQEKNKPYAGEAPSRIGI